MGDTMTVAEYHDWLKRQSNKRGNERTTIDGHSFDSKAEARRYSELRLMEQAGAIEGLTIHPVYLLQAAFKDNAGAKHKAISYEGDFGYQERGRTVVEDVKGFSTEVFKLKRKLFLYRYPEIELRVLKV